MRDFEPQDYTTIAAWYRGHGQPVPPFRVLPEIGFIVDDVAAAFLYQTDGGICLLENYIRNPDIDSTDADQALDELTKTLLATAKEIGFKKVIGLTRNDRIVARAENNGMSNIGQYKMIVRSF